MAWPPCAWLASFDPIAGLSDDFDAIDPPEQEAELVARRLFVVDDHCAEGVGHAGILAGTTSSGIKMRAQVP